MATVPPGTIRTHNVQLQNESPFLFTILHVSSALTNLLLGAVAMSAFIYANALSTPKSYIIAQHIYLCVFAYVILLPQAVLSLNIHTGWARAFTCNNKGAAHYILQVIGSILGLAGCLRVLLQHHRHGFFRDIHGILGLITMVLTVLSLIGGVVSLNSSKFSAKKNFLTVAHATFGSFTLIFAFLSMIFPMTDHFYLKTFGSTNLTLFIALIVASLLLILSSPVMNARRILA